MNKGGVSYELTAKLNRIRNILGKDEHFQRKKTHLFHLVVSLVTAFSASAKK